MGKKKSNTFEAYKGFDKSMACRGFNYEIGKTYDNGGQPVVRCGPGAFHWTDMPQDAFSYYGPATSRYAIVSPSGDIARAGDGEDTKGASSILSVTVELSLGELTRRAVAWVAERAKAQGNGNYAAGDYGHASAAGDYGHASAAGDYGHASAAGSGGHASAAGSGGHASAAGDYGHASAAGYRGHASAAGYRGHASAAGYRGHASVKGRNAVAHAAGFNGTATAEVGGAISLAAYDNKFNLVAVRSSMVGENDVEPGKTYRLTTAGEFEEVVE